MAGVTLSFPVYHQKQAYRCGTNIVVRCAGVMDRCRRFQVLFRPIWMRGGDESATDATIYPVVCHWQHHFPAPCTGSGNDSNDDFVSDHTSCADHIDVMCLFQSPCVICALFGCCWVFSFDIVTRDTTVPSSSKCEYSLSILFLMSKMIILSPNVFGRHGLCRELTTQNTKNSHLTFLFSLTVKRPMN